MEASDLAPEAAPHADPGKRFVLLVVAVVAIGCAIGIGAAIALRGGGGDANPTPSSTSTTLLSLDPEAQREHAAEFLNAWARSRRAEAVVEYDTTRSDGAGSTRSTRSVLVQLPPQRLFGEFGTLEGILQGEAVACDTAIDGEVRCFDNDEEDDFFVALEREVTTLRTLLVGDPRTYWVTPLAAGCYDLTLAEAVVVQPFGRTATICFDPSADVLREAVYRFGNGVVETRVATSIRTDVTATDFETIIDTPPS